MLTKTGLSFLGVYGIPAESA